MTTATAPINPTEEQFVRFIQEGDSEVYPLVFRLENDSLTANAVFKRIEREQKHAFFLESVETGEKIGRYSFMGFDPRVIISFADGEMTVADPDGNVLSTARGSDPLDLLQGYMDPFRCVSYEGLPPLWAGAVGYMSYDCVHYFEPTVGEMKPDGIGLPEMMWMVPRRLLAFDHTMSRIFLITVCHASEMDNVAEFYRKERGRVAEIVKGYLTLTEFTIDLEEVIERQQKPVDVEVPEGRFTYEEYCRIIEKAKSHIYEGDVFQVVPSQRFALDLDFDPYSVYRHLRHLNPSPYMFYLKFRDAVLCGASPEMMVRCIGKDVTLKPIAGSRPRGGTEAEDRRLEAELLSDEKELAEHMMLVDLGRNDLGRIAQIGTVKVGKADLMTVERYSHVMHIVSTVTAQLAEGMTAFDAVRATFPAGTLSGAPKIRAMQIINEVEPTRRNVYAGLCGYFAFDGDADNCIALRMMVANRGKVYVQAGGGIVADSQPEAEYQEIINKASAVLRAIQLAREDGK